MKKAIILLVFIAGVISLSAQDTSLIKQPSIGGSFYVKDFPTAAKMFGLNPHGWSCYLAPGINGLFTTGLNRHWDFTATLGVSNTRYKTNEGVFYYHDLGDGYSGHPKILTEFNALATYSQSTPFAWGVATIQLNT